MVQVALTATAALVLISAGAIWPWPLGALRVHVLFAPPLREHGDRLVRRLRRLGADVRTDQPRSLAHVVLRLEESPTGRVLCRLAVRDGMCYRLRELAADRRWWTDRTVATLQAERRLEDDFPDI